MNLIKKLERIGLNEKEAGVYVALLEMGDATVQQIALKTGLKRATTYIIIEGLIKKGLASILTKKKKNYYLIEHPSQLLSLLEDEKNAVEVKINLVKNLLPELEILEKLTQERTKVRFFEGLEGIRMIQKDIIRTRPKVTDSIYNLNQVVENFPPTDNDHRQIVNRLKIKSRTLVIYDPKQPVPKLPILNYGERKYLPLNKFPFHADFAIYGDKVALVAIRKKMIGLIIENSDIAQGIKSLFELAWQGAQNYQSLRGRKFKQ